jgi:hypothetical protein
MNGKLKKFWRKNLLNGTEYHIKWKESNETT